jgi:peroxiredoxin
MKTNPIYYYVLALLVLVAYSSKAQDPREILKKAIAKMNTIENGYYSMSKSMKYMSGPDTIKYNYECYFKKIKNDSISKILYQNHKLNNGEILGSQIYDGSRILTKNKIDSFLTVIPVSKFPNDARSYIRNNDFYGLFTNNGDTRLPKDSIISDTNCKLFLDGIETLNGIQCYNIRRVVFEDAKDTNDEMRTLFSEYHYWVSKDEYLTLQYSDRHQVLLNNDTMIQYRILRVNKFEINNLTDNRYFSRSVFPSDLKERIYEPYKAPELLDSGVIAPEWELTSMYGEKAKLSDYKGKVVLLDFFYKSCGFCMKAIPYIAKLYEKYKDKDFVIIGMNPNDTKESGIAQYLEKKGVKYPVMLDARPVAKTYNVSGYPTMYLIDKNGKIIDTIVGYDKSMEEEIEKTIKNALEQK